MTLGLTNGIINAGLVMEGTLNGRLNAYGQSLGGNINIGSQFTKGNAVGVTTDPTKSGIVANLDVIEYRAMVQLASGATDQAVITATSALQQLANKVDRDEADYVIESYNNGSNWYRLYKSGWCEQGGKPAGTNSSRITVNLLKPYKDTNYIILNGFANTSGTENRNDPIVISNITTSGFEMGMQTTARMFQMWQACGYIA
jgi:hypothetical protein